MPLVKVHTSVPVPEDRVEPLLSALSSTAAKVLGKPEAYVMVALSHGPMRMAGRPGPAAFVDVRAIGAMPDAKTAELSRRITALLGDHAGIPGDRVFLNFTAFAGRDWGHDGGTFG